MTAATGTPPVAPPRRSAPAAALDWWDRHPVLMFSVLGAVVGVLYLCNLSSSPDFNADEVVYAGLSRNIASRNALSLTGPFLVHPPMDFFLGSWWARITGTADAPVLTVLMRIRVLSALCCVTTAVVTGITARDLLARSGSSRRVLAGMVTTLLVALNGFMLSFGRTALIEPAAIAIGAVIVLTAFRLRHRSALQQIIVLGLLIGLGTLTKQTVVFIALTPLVVGLLQRIPRRAMIGAAAVLVGGLIWSSFPIWAAVNGSAEQFFSQQSVSIARLIGILHTSGVTLPNGSPGTQFLRTFGLYATGYATLFVAAVAWSAIAVSYWRPTGARRPDDAVALLLGYGLLAFGFLAYSFAFGAGNQQFMMYSVAPGALLCSWLCFARQRGTMEPAGGTAAATTWPDLASPELVAPGSAPGGDSPDLATTGFGIGQRASRPVLSGLVVGLLLAVGLLGWLRYYVVELDQGTLEMANYITENAPCVPINASGSQPRWAAALPDNPVTFYRSGPQALQGNQHLFLLSPKDVRYGYGNMSPNLAGWITSNGRMLFKTESRSSEELQLWAVGDVPAVPVSSDCAGSPTAPSDRAPAGEYLVLLGAVLVVVIAGGGAAVRASRRRNALDGGSAAPEPDPELVGD